MNYLANEALRRNQWIFNQSGRMLRLPDGTEFRGVAHDEYHSRWTVGPEPVLAASDVIEVPVPPHAGSGTVHRRIKYVQPIRMGGQLIQQEVRFS